MSSHARVFSCAKACELQGMRQLRRDYVGAIHHVFVRGVARSAVAVDEADYERELRSARGRGAAIRALLPRVVLSTEPLAPLGDLEAREPVAGDALARHLHRADVQPAAREIGSPLPGALRIAPHRERRLPARTGAVSTAQPRARGDLRSTGGLALVELLRDCRPAAAALVPRLRPSPRTARLAACLRRLGSKTAFSPRPSTSTALPASRHDQISQNFWPGPRTAPSRALTFAMATPRRRSHDTWE